MDSPTPEDVRAALAPLDAQQQKIVAGMLAVMMKEPSKVREREWMAERLTEMTLLAGELDADTPEAGVEAVAAFLQANATALLSASLLLFQRVGLDLAPRAESGFTFEEALRQGLGYLPSAEATPLERNLGEQPLARLMAERGLKPSDLVAASTEQLTHKLVSRAMKGRRLKPKAKAKVQRAWNAAASAKNAPADLFNY